MTSSSKTKVWIRDMPRQLIDYLLARELGENVYLYTEPFCGQQRPLQKGVARRQGPGCDTLLTSPSTDPHVIIALMESYKIYIQPSGTLFHAFVRNECGAKHECYGKTIIDAVVHTFLKLKLGNRPEIDDAILHEIDPQRVWTRRSDLDNAASALRG